MKTENKWIILDNQTGKTIYGIGEKTMRFSTREIAIEVAEQLFKNSLEFMVLNIDDIWKA